MDEHEDKLKPEFREDLRRAYGRGVTVPTDVDESMKALVRQRFIMKRRVRQLARWGAVGAAAAAVALVILWTELPRGEKHTGPPADLATRRVDILDAFALARALEQPGKPDPKWDYNGDGVVDRRDVDEMAMAAVRLTPGTAR